MNSIPTPKQNDRHDIADAALKEAYQQIGRAAGQLPRNEHASNLQQDAADHAGLIGCVMFPPQSPSEAIFLVAAAVSQTMFVGKLKSAGNRRPALDKRRMPKHLSVKSAPCQFLITSRRWSACTTTKNE